MLSAVLGMWGAFLILYSLFRFWIFKKKQKIRKGKEDDTRHKEDE